MTTYEACEDNFANIEGESVCGKPEEVCFWEATSGVFGTQYQIGGGDGSSKVEKCD